MAELKAKVVLKAKGQEAFIPVKQMMVSLKWNTAVDLDLMAFYIAKDGRVGCIFSSRYAGGTMGDLNAFPFIQLSEDAGVGAKGGENEEILRVTKMDDIAELYICTINFTDAAQNRNVAFNTYNAHVMVMDDKGDSVAVPLDSSQPGTVAIIAKIDNSSFMGAKLINENRIVDMSTFQSTIPAANTLKLSSKSPEEVKADNRLFELKKKASLAVKSAGIEGQKAMVAMALDISGSMHDTFKKGIVQRLCERLLALGTKFDDNGAIDIFLFGEKHYEVGELKEANFYGYVDREIVPRYPLEYETNYAGVAQRIVEKYFPGALKKGGGFLGMGGGFSVQKQERYTGHPAMVLFVTDGDNFDQRPTQNIIVEASKLPIFWQFIGIGSTSFPFLEKLDTISGRFVDNANFFSVNDIDRIADEELYKRLLGEFPSWLKLAKSKGLY